jgi:hypothetical protein
MRTCAALVEEVFRPQQTVVATQQASLLPTLLERVNLSMWSQEPAKNLNSDIKALQGRKAAAAKLFDEIEKEAEQIDQRLQEKTQEAKIQRTSKGFLGLSGLACTSCGPMLDKDEISFQTSGSATKNDILELRPVLRSRLHECEQTLTERDSELRQLKHDMDTLRRERDALRQEEKDVILNGFTNKKEKLLQRYGAAFSFVEGSQLKVAFLAWRQHCQRRATRGRILKRTSLALASDSAQCKALLFGSWQVLVREKRQSQQLAQNKRRQTTAQSYAAKFVMQSEATVMRAAIIGWWRVSKESSLLKHISAAREKREDQAIEDSATARLMASKPAPSQAANDKACCTLM